MAQKLQSAIKHQNKRPACDHIYKHEAWWGATLYICKARSWLFDIRLTTPPPLKTKTTTRCSKTKVRHPKIKNKSKGSRPPKVVLKALMPRPGLKDNISGCSKTPRWSIYWPTSAWKSRLLKIRMMRSMARRRGRSCGWVRRLWYSSSSSSARWASTHHIVSDILIVK